MNTPINLTPTEVRILTAYRVMDHRAKGEALMFVERRAKDHPKPPPPPKLRLIAGGAS